MEGLVQQTVAKVAIPLLFFSLNTGIISPCQTFWLWLQIIGWKRAVATSELQKVLIKIILSTELLLMLFYTERKNNKNPKTKQHYLQPAIHQIRTFGIPLLPQEEFLNKNKMHFWHDSLEKHVKPLSPLPSWPDSWLPSEQKGL